MGDDSRPPATGYPVHPYPPPQPASAANGYPQQPSSAYPYPAPPQQQPNPYFYHHNNNNNYQAAPPPYYVDQRRSVFLRRLIAGMMAVFIILGVILFITWLVLRPKFPEFRVDSAAVTGFNLSSSVSGAWDFRVAVSNPNSKVSITYEEVESNLAYDSAFIADNTLAPFAQGKKNLTTIRVSFAASGSYLNDRTLKALSADRSDDGVVGFEVRIFSRVLFDAGIWRIRRRLLRVFCDDLKIAIGSSGSGNMTGGAKGCRVGW
uniref:Late embryogenesis abundant protein LEA-2 subgroup domain-containing protein n=1 Tax=Kalanchoe fedtschenkoi TaxID=63787 RepID=A0A7N0V0Y1_KALFE